MTLQPGSLVRLANRPGRTYQVVNLDEFSDCVWVRSWPLCAQRNSTFSVSIGQVAGQALGLRRQAALRTYATPCASLGDHLNGSD